MAADLHLEPGATIHGTWRVERLIGEGGMGTIYKGSAVRSGRACAIKLIRPDLLSSEQSRESFKREAGVWVMLGKHPFVLQAYAVDGYRDTILIAMELIEPDDAGCVSLADHIRLKTLTLEQVLSLGVKTCQGLEHSYQHGLSCHRDLKPNNILVARNGDPKICDFGLAVARVEESPRKNFWSRIFSRRQPQTARSIVGTPHYMSPEQWQNSETCDQRTDIYALGVILFQLASGGKLPFIPAASSRGGLSDTIWLSEMMKLHLSKRPPNVGGPLAPVIQQCLQKQADNRFPDVAGVREALEHIQKDRGLAGDDSRDAEALTAQEWNDRGASLRVLDRNGEAIKCFEAAARLDDSLGLPDANIGLILQLEGRFEEAITHYDRALEREPTEFEPWHGKGICLARLKRIPESLQCLDKAIEARPDRADNWRIKGQVLAATGRSEAALHCFRTAVRLDPEDFDAWKDLGRLCGILGKFDEALRCGDRIIQIVPHRADGFKMKGLALERLGQPREAARCYENALKSQLDDPIAWYSVGAMLCQCGEAERALEFLDQCLKLKPDYQMALANRGGVLITLGRTEEALAVLDKSLKLDPSDLVALWSKAVALWNLGRTDDAVGCYRSFVTRARGKGGWEGHVRTALARIEGN